MRKYYDKDGISVGQVTKISVGASANLIIIDTPCEAKTVTNLQAGLWGQGLGVDIQNFAGIFFQHAGFMANQKN
jgi:hypothetical protein